MRDGLPPGIDRIDPPPATPHDGLTAPTIETGSTPRGPRGRRYRRVGVSLGAIAFIGVAPWYLQTRPSLPFLGGGRDEASGYSADNAGFVTFGSQGIKLGPADGVTPKIGQPAPDFTLLNV